MKIFLLWGVTSLLIVAALFEGSAGSVGVLGCLAGAGIILSSCMTVVTLCGGEV